MSKSNTNIRKGELITIPISEWYGNQLLEQDETSDDQVYWRSGRPIYWGYLPTWQSVSGFFEEMFYQTISRIGKYNKIHLSFHWSNIEFYYKTEGGDYSIAKLYGKWDTSGPRLILEWLVDSPNALAVRIIKTFIVVLQNYEIKASHEEKQIFRNQHLKPVRSIYNRMETAKEYFKKIAKKTKKNKGNNKSHSKNVINNTLYPAKSNIAMPLAKLLGGNRHTQMTRRKH